MVGWKERRRAAVRPSNFAWLSGSSLVTETNKLPSCPVKYLVFIILRIITTRLAAELSDSES